MKVWIFMDTESVVGPGSIKGIYKTEEECKMAIANYVLEEEVNTTYIDLFSMEIAEEV